MAIIVSFLGEITNHGCHLAASVPCVDHAGRFKQQDERLISRFRAMANTLRNNEHIIWKKDNIVLPFELNGEFTTNHHEELVGVVMLMPDEFALNFCNASFVVIDASHRFRGPLLSEAAKGVIK